MGGNPRVEQAGVGWWCRLDWALVDGVLSGSGGLRVAAEASEWQRRPPSGSGGLRSSLSAAQSKMKKLYDKNSLSRNFLPGDFVLVLLPVVGSCLQAKFCGPYEVERKMSDTDYVIKTPDRKKKSRVCHVNMLKKCCPRKL